jgi:hypothetical protein
MGTQFFDQYSILHFAFGIVAYFFNVNLLTWFIIHTLFEIIENTVSVMSFVNSHLKWFWPGQSGKPYADSSLNSVGDTVFGMIGWIFAYAMDEYGKKKHLYDPNIKR